MSKKEEFEAKQTELEGVLCPVLNKADRLVTSSIMRVCGAMMWSLGEVIRHELLALYSGVGSELPGPRDESLHDCHEPALQEEPFPVRHDVHGVRSALPVPEEEALHVSHGDCREPSVLQEESLDGSELSSSSCSRNSDPEEESQDMEGIQLGGVNVLEDVCNVVASGGRHSRAEVCDELTL